MTDLLRAFARPNAIIALFLVSLFIRSGPAIAADPPPHDTAWHNRQTLHLLELRPADGWRDLAGGMRYRKVAGSAAGTAQATIADEVLVHYTGRFIDGAVFDSSVERGEPVRFPLGQLIEGWQQGIPLMHVGETFEFAIPQQLGYGPRAKGPIPGGATLLFTVELLGIGSEAIPSP